MFDFDLDRAITYIIVPILVVEPSRDDRIGIFWISNRLGGPTSGEENQAAFLVRPDLAQVDIGGCVFRSVKIACKIGRWEVCAAQSFGDWRDDQFVTIVRIKLGPRLVRTRIRRRTVVCSRQVELLDCAAS